MAVSIKDNFLDITDFSTEELLSIIDLASKIKKDPSSFYDSLKGKKLGVIFEKPSTRTRISFDIGIKELGGYSTIIDKIQSHIGKESTHDTAKVLSRFFDCVAIRTHSHQELSSFANSCSVPVINALTAYSHPCQIMAAWLTFNERIGSIEGKKLVWLGDGNNILTSYIHLAQRIKFELVVCTPKKFTQFDQIHEAKYEGADIKHESDPMLATKDADIIITDTWFSMGDTNKTSEDDEIFAPYQVNKTIMNNAKDGALFSHCLPAIRGSEVTDEVMDSKESVVFDEAENRLHAQKAILHFLLAK